jgi:hypothetical protein
MVGRCGESPPFSCRDLMDRMMRDLPGETASGLKCVSSKVALDLASIKIAVVETVEGAKTSR